MRPSSSCGWKGWLSVHDGAHGRGQLYSLSLHQTGLGRGGGEGAVGSTWVTPHSLLTAFRAQVHGHRWCQSLQTSEACPHALQRSASAVVGLS